MRINHNISSMITQGALYGVSREQSKTLEKLSTGLRINRASDDAAGLGVSENLRKEVRGIGMAKRNAQDGISLLNIAEGSMNEVSDILQRMRELAVQSANDTLTSTERGYTDSEFQALSSEIDRIVNTTRYNTQTLINGDWGGSILHVGANSSGDDEISVTINSMLAADIGVSGDLLDQTTAVAALTAMDTAIGSVNAERSNVGTLVNRLEHTVNNLINQEHNNQAAESAVRDTDFAVETANFTKYQILTQSATAMLAQANLVPQSVLGLLGR